MDDLQKFWEAASVYGRWLREHRDEESYVRFYNLAWLIYREPRNEPYMTHFLEHVMDVLDRDIAEFLYWKLVQMNTKLKKRKRWEWLVPPSSLKSKRFPR